MGTYMFADPLAEPFVAALAACCFFFACLFFLFVIVLARVARKGRW